MKHGDAESSTLLLDADDLSSAFFSEDAADSGEDADNLRARRISVRKAMAATAEPSRKGAKKTVFRYVPMNYVQNFERLFAPP